MDWRRSQRKNLSGILDGFGEEKASQIKAIYSDMWKAYLKVIKAHASKALHVFALFGAASSCASL